MTDLPTPTAPSRRREFALGALHILPLAAGAVPFGLLLGGVAARAGITPAELALMSALVFAGSSQFVAAELWLHGAAGLTIAGSILMVNLRFVLMGAALAPRLERFGGWRSRLALAFLVDENWALALRRGEGLTLAYWAGLSVPIYAAWMASTVAGCALGSLVTDPAAWGLDFAFTAVFLCLLVAFWEGPRSLPPWIVSAATAVTVNALVPGGAWHILAGGLAGAGTAALRGRAGRAA